MRMSGTSQSVVPSDAGEGEQGRPQDVVEPWPPGVGVQALEHPDQVLDDDLGADPVGGSAAD